MIKRYNDKDDFYLTRVPKNVVGNGIVFDRDDYEKSENSKIIKKGNFEYYWPFGDKECNLKESDYNYFEKAIKRMGLNNLYRD